MGGARRVSNAARVAARDLVAVRCGQSEDLPSEGRLPRGEARSAE